MKRRPLLQLAVLAGFLVLFALAWGILAGNAARGGAPYDQPLSLLSATRLLPLATPAAMKESYDSTTTPWCLAGALLALGAILATLNRPASRLRTVALGLQVLVVWPGWLGLFALPFDLFSFATARQDAEWLAEAWPPIEVAGCWLVAAVLLCVNEAKAR